MSDQTTAGAGGEPRSADEIRDDIEQTREQLGETVEALAAKTDVKAQAHDRIEAAKGAVAHNVRRKPVAFAAAGAVIAVVVVGRRLARR